METIKENSGKGIRDKVAMDYKDLRFYQKSCDVVKHINSEIKGWPKNMQAQVISRQLFSAATSIGANIAEGHGRHLGREYIRFLRIAQGSANEVDHWLHTANSIKIGSSKNLQRIMELNNETRKMLTATIRTLSKKQAGKSLQEDSIPYSPIPYPLEK